tara:strand:+ start:7342 stop:8025 length:684 start_codon:yes stop_codon:yes gene_type:complete
MNKALRLENLLQDLPKSSRKLDTRIKVSNLDRNYARLYGRHYYDGNRKQGYGGYYYDGRWVDVAKRIIKEFDIKDEHSICEIGCAKGFLLNDFTNLIKNVKCIGIDISLYALREAIKKHNILYINANASSIPLKNNSVEHTICINSLHNFLSKADTIKAISEIQRITTKNSYLRIAAYKNNSQKEIIDKWATGGRCYLHVDEWLEVFKDAGYKGYYDWWHPDNTIRL